MVGDRKPDNLVRKPDNLVGPSRKPEDLVDTSRRKPENQRKPDNPSDLTAGGKFDNQMLVDGKFDNLDERAPDEDDKAQEVSSLLLVICKSNINN